MNTLRHLKFLFIVGCFLSFDLSLRAVKPGGEDFGTPLGGVSEKSAETQKALEARLLESILLPEVGVQRLLISKERVSPQSSDAALVETLLQEHFESLKHEFPQGIQVSMDLLWKDEGWVQYSRDPYFNFHSFPLGMTHFLSADRFILVLDYRLQSTPLLSKLFKLLFLTHFWAPKSHLLTEKGIAFYRRTVELQDALTSVTSYWSFLQWLQIYAVQKTLKKEIRRSHLPLADIRALLQLVEEPSKESPIKALNRYIRDYEPILFWNQEAKAFLQTWINEAISNSGLAEIQSRALQKKELRSNVIDFVKYREAKQKACQALLKGS